MLPHFNFQDMSEELLDEITSINSIYGEHTLVATSDDSTTYALTLPIRSNISLRTEFPADYPDAPPRSLAPNTLATMLQRARANRSSTASARSLLKSTYPARPAFSISSRKEARNFNSSASMQAQGKRSNKLLKRTVRIQSSTMAVKKPILTSSTSLWTT